MSNVTIAGLEFWTFLSIVVSVLGLLLAAYFWFNPRQIQGRLRYKFATKRSYFTSISRWSNNTFHFDVWNPSKAGVDAGNIRDPLKIAFPEDVVIKDVSVEKTAGGIDPSKIKVTINGDNIILVRWTYLDQGMGFRLAIEPEPKGTSGVYFGRPLRAPGREWATVSGRFKDFSLSEPMDLDDLPERWRITVGALCFSITATAIAALFLKGYGMLPGQAWLEEQLFVRALLLAVSALALSLASVAALLGLDASTKFIFNTRSPMDGE